MSSLYIHIPFCRTKCSYCDFYSVALRNPERLVIAILDELSVRAALYNPPFETLYIGGGTPTVLPLDEMRTLLRGVMPYIAEGAEVTVEANPDDVTPVLASMLATEGVNRVSMGVQSLVDNELRAISRRHDAAGAVKAVATLRDAGITNISCDLIYGLPGQTLESFALSLDKLIELRPPHISAYLLSYEPGTRLTRDLAAGRVRQADDEESLAYYRHLCSTLKAAGYEHYEISNFALPGFRSRHNSAYWDTAHAYLGLGPAAHSYDGSDTRSANVASVSRYLAGEPAEVEHLTAEERREERIMLALRTARGIDPAELSSNLSALSNFSNLSPTPGGRLRIPEESWLIADTIIADLI